MKEFIASVYFIVLFFTPGYSQGNEIKTIFLNKDVTTHFLSKIMVDEFDISTHFVVGELKNKKIIAIKPINDENNELGVLSIIGQDYFVQYRLKYTNSIDFADKRVLIGENDKDHFLHPEYELTNIDMFNMCKKIEKLDPNYNNTSSRENKLVIRLNNIIVKDRNIFIDFSIENNTNLLYDVTDIKYMIDDKKITKNTNVQRVMVDANYTYNQNKSFKKHYRNIVCFDKMTFPDNKVFVIELSEKQISGRTAKLVINYLDILNADTL